MWTRQVRDGLGGLLGGRWFFDNRVSTEGSGSLARLEGLTEEAEENRERERSWSSFSSMAVMLVVSGIGFASIEERGTRVSIILLLFEQFSRRQTKN